MPQPTTPGWFGDPSGRHHFRFWDGVRWTDDVATGGLQARDPLADHPNGTTPGATPAGWYADPTGRHQHRYWDGARWTDHAATSGIQTEDPLEPPTSKADVGAPARASRATDRRADKIRQQARSATVPISSQSRDHPLLKRSVLVVNQKPKLLSGRADYKIYDEDGHPIGAVQDIGRRFLRPGDGTGTYRLQVVDAQGTVVLGLLRPSKYFRSKMTVTSAQGPVGTIKQKNVVFGKDRFEFESMGRVVGSINAEDWQSWDFNVQDETGAEVARVTKTWAGWTKERFSKADNYVVQIHRELQEPLRSLVFAASLAIDIALKEGDPLTGSTRRTRRYR